VIRRLAAETCERRGGTVIEEMLFFPFRSTSQFDPPQTYAHALEAWRSASVLVRERWTQLRMADTWTRAGAFAAYLTALDLEEATAAELAFLALAEAA
jgi:hypothetical protein